MIARSELKTIQIGNHWFPEKAGGLDRYYYELMQHLPGAGVAVNGFVVGSDQVAVESLGRVRSFATRDAGLIKRWRAVRSQVGNALAEESASLVVAHFALYAAPCLDLIGSSPFVVHFQGPWSAESRAEGASPLVSHVKERLERSVYRRASRLLVLSRAFRQVLIELHGIPEDRIEVIPGGVDCARWQPVVSKAEARRQIGWPGDRPIVFVVRRLVRRMGLEGLIDSVEHIRRAVPDVLILIAGKGPLAGELAQRARARGVEDNVRVIGFVPDEQLAAAYRAADITVVPSSSLEGFGLIVVESLAAGTPALVTNVGGLPETIEGFAPQCILEQRDPEYIGASIADALLGRLPLPDAEQCIAHATNNFDWSGLAPRISDAYRRSLQ